MKELKENELNNVNGGDNNDRKKEQASTPGGVKYLYNIGDHVEVYISGYHVCTKGGTIVERQPQFAEIGCSWVYIGRYKVQYDEGGFCWADADDIEAS